MLACWSWTVLLVKTEDGVGPGLSEVILVFWGWGVAAYLAVTNLSEEQDSSHAANIARFALGAVAVTPPTHASWIFAVLE